MLHETARRRKRTGVWRRSGGTRSAAIVAVVAFAVAAGGCTGSDGAASTSTTEVGTGAIVTTPYPVYGEGHAAPYPPIAVPVGARFSLVLDAEPSQGFRWEVVEQADPLVLVALGSEFRAKAGNTLVVETTTTTAPPPVEPPPGPSPTATSGASTTAAPTTIAPAPEPTTTTTQPTSSVQAISYAAERVGVARIVVRYGRVGAAPTPEDRTLTFTVDVPGTPAVVAPG